VAFPLGGIGTGNVSLSSCGQLRDWEIFNRPAKGFNLPNTFFAIRTQVAGEKPLGRVLEGPLQPPHTLSHGYQPEYYGGLPRLTGATFYGQYPFAKIVFSDPALPLQLQLEAFTPLLPLNPEDSGIPCAILTYTAHNPGDKPVSLTLAGSLFNPVGGLQYNVFKRILPNPARRSRNEFRQAEGLAGLFLHAEGVDPTDLNYGSLSLTTDFPEVTAKPTWLRGAWWDFLREFWNDLLDDGRLTDLGYDRPADDGKPDTGSLAVADTLQPGQTQAYRFILAWYFPNRLDSWKYPEELKPDAARPSLIRNHYATRFSDAWQVAGYVNQHLPGLESVTRNFHDALFGSTLPPAVLDAVSANIVPLRSNTCFWLEDGRFFGWEGCHDQAGCCTGSCTHVWSYAYTVAFLFPSLEREMRRIEFVVETEDDGYMAFRTLKTSGEKFIWQWGDQKPEAAVDGQMGSILRAYREWQLSGDKSWLQMIWPGLKRAIAYAGNHWDTDGDNVLDGRQHNTYDIEFYGPNPLSNIYYLAALRAVEELARTLGEPELAETMRRTFRHSSERMEQLLWNGDYYIQHLDDVDAYYYQHGRGCLSDQLLGQLHARALNLGDLLPPEHIKTAIKSVFDHNFRHNFSDYINCQRTYVLNDEAGLLMCSWPNGGEPRYPFVYSDEVWTGTEYQVAAHLIYEGCLAEGLTVVEAIRARHDGIRRNPWNEVECGHHYARSMASWALLLALSGFNADWGRGEMHFAPVVKASTETGQFQTFWSNGRAWGIYRQHQAPDGSQGQPTLEIWGGDIGELQVTANGQAVKIIKGSG
jgi:uncharacterized protein (DUF608 family)